MICNGSETARNYTEAISYIQEGKIAPEMNLQQLKLIDGCVMLKRSMLEKVGTFEEKLFLAENVMWDYCVRGIELGYKLFECGSAFFYQIAEKQKGKENKQHALSDRRLLKEKWVTSSRVSFRSGLSGRPQSETPMAAWFPRIWALSNRT